jgi:hypothetical protein
VRGLSHGIGDGAPRVGLPRGITPSPPPPERGVRSKGGEAMKQQLNKGGAAMLRVLTVQEILSRAYFLLLKSRKQGKTSRRVSVLLRPNEVPPTGLEWTSLPSPFGSVVKIRSWFNQDLGRWGCTVIFMDTEGCFKLRDYVSGDTPTPEP